MIRRDITIQNKLGLHARAASKLVALAAEFSSDIEITSPFAKANAKSIMKVLMLQASIGTEVTIETDGTDEQLAMDAIANLIDNKFDESE